MISFVDQILLKPHRALFKRACEQKHEKACANLAKQAGLAVEAPGEKPA